MNDFTLSNLFFLHMAMNKQKTNIEKGKAVGMGSEDIKEASDILNKLATLISEKVKQEKTDGT